MNQYDLKFIADADSELYIDGEYITQLTRGGIFKISLSEGEYIIQAKTKNPKIRFKDIIALNSNKVIDISFTKMLDSNQSLRSCLKLEKYKDLDTGKYGYIDSESKVVVIPAKYQYVSPFYFGLALVQYHSTYGFIDSSGAFVIEPLYESARSVTKHSSDSFPSYYILTNDGKDGILNHDLKWIVSLDEGYKVNNYYQLAEKSKSSVYFVFENNEGLFAIHNGVRFITKFIYSEVVFNDDCFVCEIPSTDHPAFNKYCIWNIVDGRVSMSSSSIKFLKKSPKFNKSGFAYIEGVDRTGWIDKRGHFVLIPEEEYDDYGDFDGKYALVVKENKVSYVDTNNKLLIPFIYDAASPFADGRALVMKDNLFGLIDENGRELCPCIYSTFNKPGMSCMGFPLAQVSIDKKYGCIDRDGNLVIPCEYERISFIKHNVIALSDKEGTKLVNSDNDLICIIRESIKLQGFCTSYIGTGRFLKRMNSWNADDAKSCKNYLEGTFIARKNEEYGVVNHLGEIVIPFEYDGITFSTIRKYYRARKSGKIYWFNSNGELVDNVLGYSTIQMD